MHVEYIDTSWYEIQEQKVPGMYQLISSTGPNIMLALFARQS